MLYITINREGALVEHQTKSLTAEQLSSLLAYGRPIIFEEEGFEDVPGGKVTVWLNQDKFHEIVYYETE